MHTLLLCLVLFTTPRADTIKHSTPKTVQTQIQTKAQDDTVLKIRKQYTKILEKNLRVLMHSRTLPQKTVAYLVPRTGDEYEVYYTYSTESPALTKAFHKLDNLISENAILNHEGVLRLYLNMSLFVDGDYAEKYFADAQFVIQSQKKTFCKMYPSLNKEIQDVFEDAYQQYCAEK